MAGLSTLKEQRAFEKSVHEKTRRGAGELPEGGEEKKEERGRGRGSRVARRRGLRVERRWGGGEESGEEWRVLWREDCADAVSLDYRLSAIASSWSWP
jgi:hypothetical protein